MGKILAYANKERYRIFDWIISLMTSYDIQMRITDIAVLKALFNNALQMTLQDQE
jgi:hypothetical protein